MGLYASGLSYEHREVILRDKPDAMLSLSPKGTVPVYQHEDGTLIEESLELLFFALEKHDPHGWLACDREAAMALISRNDGIFKHHLDRYKYKSRYHPEAKRGDTDIDHCRAAEEIIKTYELHLTDAPYLLGETQSVADIAIFPFMRQFANTDRKWWDGEDKNAPHYPATHNWLERHISSEIYQSIMTKYAVWKPPLAG